MEAHELPLNGITVVEFSHMVMGPSVGLILADLGANVVKVEPIGGDKTRNLPGSGAGYFSMYNRNKRSICVDMKSEQGKQVVTRLVKDADVIVIGKRGEAADFASGHLGSNLERVVRASTRPVLVASRAYTPVQNILIAYDGGQSARRAVGHIKAAQSMAGLNVTLLYVGRPDSDLRLDLEQTREGLEDAGFTASIVIMPGHADDTIAEQAKESADLLVMGAYGHSRIRRLIIGSTTTQMVRSVTIPVLLFR